MSFVHHRLSAQVFDWGGDLRATLQKRKKVWFRIRANRQNGHLAHVELTLFDHRWRWLP